MINDLIIQGILFIWSSLLPMAFIFLVGGIIGGFHKESWGDVLYFPETLRWGVFGFLLCVALYLWIPILWVGVPVLSIRVPGVGWLP